MELLKERIKAEGRVLNEEVLKVDSFLNHRVDPVLMRQIGEEFARIFAGSGATLVATIESSGIAPATYAAEYLGTPLLIMKKRTSRILDEDLLQCEVMSFTKQSRYQLTASRRYISADDRVIVIDDFLAFGEAALGACSLIEKAGARVVGIGAVIEKAFQPGHDRIIKLGYDLHSLARVSRMAPGEREFVE